MKNHKLIFKSILLGCLILTGCDVKKTKVVKKEENIVITVLAGQSTSDAGVEDMIDAALKDKFPNVKLEWECVDWGKNFDRAIRARFAAGDVPDIMVGKAQDVIAYESTGNLALLEQDCYENISEDSLDVVTVDGVVYGMPYNAAYQGVIYNKEMFERYHIDVPKTEEQLHSVVTLLEENDEIPFATHYSESWQIANMTMQYMTNGIFRENELWGDYFRKGEESFASSDVMKRYYENNRYILEHSWNDALVIDQYESDRRFANGEAAMNLTGTWSMQFIESENNTFGIFPYPNESGDAKLIRETNMTFMKSATTEYGDLIDDIFKTLIDDETLMEEMLEFTQASSVMKHGQPEIVNSLVEDIAYYMETEQMIDVGIGNTQLVWSFQNDIAIKQQEWLKGEETLENVLNYADKNRSESNASY